MAIYNTYKEAVLASGSVKGIHCAMISDDGRDGVFGLKKDFSNVTANTLLCHPSGYLQTLADFLESGMRLVNGDKYTGRYGDVVDVQTHNLSTANTPLFGDETRFVVKAAAYDTETPEEKEAFDAIDTTPQQVESLGKADWKNGDKVSSDGMLGVFVGLHPDDHELCYIMEVGIDSPVLWYTNRLSKPETTAEREERERLEAAYDLYVTGFAACNRGKALDFDTFRRGFADFYLAIVDKTGYRKK